MQSNGTIEALPLTWQRSSAMALAWQCNGTAMALTWYYLGSATTILRHCQAKLSHDRHGAAMAPLKQCRDNSMAPHPALLQSTLPYSILFYSTLLYPTALDSTLLYPVSSLVTLLFSTLPCSILLYSILFYSTLLYPNNAGILSLWVNHLGWDHSAEMTWLRSSKVK